MNKDSAQIAASETIAMTASCATPLAREHLAQKHYYANFTEAKQIDIYNQAASLAVEAAVAIVINGIHYAVLMASPHQLEYLAIGFLYSEGLIAHSHELLDWEVIKLTDAQKRQAYNEEIIRESAQSTSANLHSAQLEDNASFEHLLDYDTYVVELVLNQRCHQRIQAQKRQLAGRTGCGMCGITGLSQALPDLRDYMADSMTDAVGRRETCVTKPSLDSLLSIRAQVSDLQHTHQLTGAVHAAATMQGSELCLFEDVGRHNALDKLIGWQLRHKKQVPYVVMTSRLSIELIQKSIRIRLPWLIGMSAPTSTAVRVAQRYGLGLAGFLREDRVTYYSKF